MYSDSLKVLTGFYFYPRGGSAHAAHAIATELARNRLDVTLLAGSRTDCGDRGSAEKFFSGCHVEAVDFTPALLSPDPLRSPTTSGTAPMHASYEDRSGAEDPVFAKLDDEAYELQVEAWSRELGRAGAESTDVFYLHHLTPLNEAVARLAPETPVIGHIHGSELLMLERIADGAPESWLWAEEWATRLRRWAARCDRIVINSPQGLPRAASLLQVDADLLALVPNGFTRYFEPHEVDRGAHWRRHLVDEPEGWAPGEDPGSVAYEPADLGALEGTTLLSVGRFTEVKRLPMLIEAFANVRSRLQTPASLVLLGGYPGEWEGEHPLAAIERTGAKDVFLAGWHPHASLPSFLNACDVLVHPSALEQFGLVLVEAMACALPTIAVDRGGPTDIVDDTETGWLIPPDDRRALEKALVDAINEPLQRRLMGTAARRKAMENYGWDQIGLDLANIVRTSVSSVVAA